MGVLEIYFDCQKGMVLRIWFGRKSGTGMGRNYLEVVTGLPHLTASMRL
jgi:hypothetical protein